MADKQDVCKKCGTEVEKNASKCPNCGVDNPTITTAQGIGGVIVIVIAILLLVQCVGGTSYDDYAATPISEIRELDGDEQQDVLNDFLSSNDISDEYAYEFFKCMSDMVNSKDDSLPLSEVLGWCKSEFENNNQSFSNYYVDYVKLESQFSPFTGAHQKLELMIMTNMHDSGSYDHVRTLYRVVKDGSDSYLFLTTEFRGSNAFGGIVKQSVSAKADLETGEIFEVIE